MEIAVRRHGAIRGTHLIVHATGGGQSKEWCTVESFSTRQCYWDTWDQCRQSKMHLMGGTCFRNPAYVGRVPATDPGFREVPNILAPSPYAARLYRPDRPVRRHRRVGTR